MTNRKVALIVKEQNPLVMDAGENVREACRRMCKRNLGSVLVVDGDKRLAGIFTGRDAVRMLMSTKPIDTTTLREAMTRNPVTITPDARAVDALRAMNEGGFRHLPVVEDGRIWGVVSRSDFKGMELDRLDQEVYLWESIR